MSLDSDFYMHLQSSKSTPPIIMGSLKCFLRKLLKSSLCCTLRAAACKIDFLFTTLCGHVGQPLMEADAAAIKGKARRSKFKSFDYTVVNIPTPTM